MTRESPRGLLLRLGALLQSIATRREDGRDLDAADAMLWTCGPDGRCTSVSRGWSEYTGLAKADALRQGWITAAHPEDRERAARVLGEAVTKREPFAVDYRLRRRDGAHRWVMDSGRPRYGAGGEILGYVGSVLDVHELSLAEEARRESEARLHLLVAINAATRTLADPEQIKAVTGRMLAAHLGAEACTYDESEGRFRVEGAAGREWSTGDTELAQVVADGCRESLARARAARELEELNRRKDEFLATLSHELRNPLAPLRNSLQLLRLSRDRDSAVAPIHEMMDRQVNLLVRLVDDLLDMSRITRGTFELRRELVDLAAVVRNAVETSTPLLESAAHRLEVSLPASPVQVDGDGVRLTQILGNLLNNAARYTPRGGEIRIALRREGEAALIEVRDNGAGIAAELLPRLFGMFMRGAGSTGMGVGLALARSLAEMHGGTIEARSDGPGRGAQFIVRLPLASRTAPGVALADSAAPIAPRRILVVDDNQDAAQTLGMLLTHLGAEVEIAHDGPAALTAFARRRPDMVLLDIGMPGMDGYEVARRLRHDGGAKGVPIVALTGRGQEADRHRVRDAGFDRHLVKPADLATLHGLLGSLQ